MSCESCNFWDDEKNQCTYPDRTKVHLQCEIVSLAEDLEKEEAEAEYWRRKWEEEYYRMQE